PDERVKQELKALVKRVEATKDEKPRGISGYLIVNNGHRDFVHVYINGGNVGHVYPGRQRSFPVGDDPINDTTVIFAHDTTHARNWGPHYIVTPNSGSNHIWNIR